MIETDNHKQAEIVRHRIKHQNKTYTSVLDHTALVHLYQVSSSADNFRNGSESPENIKSVKNEFTREIFFYVIAPISITRGLGYYKKRIRKPAYLWHLFQLLKNHHFRRIYLVKMLVWDF